MKNVVKQYSFKKKDTDSIRYFNWLKGVRVGSPNGFTGIRNKVLRVSKTQVVHQREFREKTLERIVKKILSIRDELESHKTRRSAFSGIGAEVIHWELEQRKIRNVPSIPTIARILSRHGKTGKEKPKRNSNNQPYPYFKADKMGTWKGLLYQKG